MGKLYVKIEKQCMVQPLSYSKRNQLLTVTIHKQVNFVVSRKRKNVHQEFRESDSFVTSCHCTPAKRQLENCHGV